MMIALAERPPKVWTYESNLANFFANEFVKLITYFPFSYQQDPSIKQIKQLAGEVLEVAAKHYGESDRELSRKQLTAQAFANLLLKRVAIASQLLNTLVLGVTLAVIGFFTSKLVLGAGSALVALSIARSLELPDSRFYMQEILQNALQQQKPQSN